MAKRSGERIVGYDNERLKGDHKHLDGVVWDMTLRLVLPALAVALLGACSPEPSAEAAAEAGVCWRVRVVDGQARREAVERGIANLQTCAARLEAVRMRAGEPVEGKFEGRSIFASETELSQAASRTATRYAVLEPAERARVQAAIRTLLEAEAKRAAPASQAGDAPQGFSHQPGLDLDGYYLPTAPVEVGRWRLRHLAILPGFEFGRWEAGRRSATHGPVMLEWEDIASPRVKDAQGREGYSRSVRVLPDAYRLEAGRIALRGRAEGLGPVSFEGALDDAAVARAKADVGSSGEAAALTGTLRVGDGPPRRVALSFWIED